MKKMLLSLITCLLLLVAAQAQQAKGKLDIQFNKNILQPGDSLLITMDYKDGSGKLLNQPMATLELIVENEQGQRTLLRWPVINGEASGALYLPDSLPPGKYTLFAGLQQRFFEVTGKIKDYNNSGNIQAMLFTKSGDWAEQEVPVAPDGSFAIRNWLFEDNGLLAFSATKNNNRPLDIRISTLLDSGNAPLAVAGRVFYIGNPPSAMQQTLSQPVETSEAAFTGQGDLMPAVLVRTTVKSLAQQFNEEHVSGLFRSGDERLISIMDDPAAFGSPGILWWLQGRVAGLQINQVGFNGGAASWRGSPVMFFIDEIRASAQQVTSLPMADIAIVKAYPPHSLALLAEVPPLPFIPAAVVSPGIFPNRQVFKVRGYTPAATALNMNKRSL